CRSAARFGAGSLAVVGIANRIEAIQFVVGSSIGIAGAALVGQNIGAGRPDRAAAAIRVGLSWCVPVSIVLTALVATCPTWFLGLFTRDPEAIRVGIPYLRVLSSCMIATGVELVTFESILGSGH